MRESKRIMTNQSQIITLLTDFGLSDTYVGAMKGVILSAAPHVRIVDLTHEVPAQGVLQGAFLLQTAWRSFPAGTIHVAIVDPGVGGARRRLALRCEGQVFIGPDNGVLSGALPDEVRGYRAAGESYVVHQARLPDSIEAVTIDAGLFSTPSATFEGRDVFAPAAALLTNGKPLEELGTRIDAINAFPAFKAPARGEDALDGVILHSDRFGNLITDIRAADLTSLPVVIVADKRVTLARTYEEAAGLTAIVGSSGFVEIALPNGSAAQALGLGPGDTVRVEG